MKSAIVIILFFLVCYGATQLTKKPLKCTKSDDCGAGHCCVAVNRPRGKRWISYTHGICEPRGDVGDACFVDYSVYHGDRNYPATCLCKNGLTCYGNRVLDIPLGEMGTCR